MMTRPLSWVLFLPILSMVFVVSPAPAAAQTAVLPDSTVYRLSQNSRFEEGCFPPCLCPVLIQDGVLGTFRMTRAAPDPLYQVYDITEVNWLVPGIDDRVTGKGTYRIGGEFARMHQLHLDLKVGERDVQHFDSGLVQGGAEFPAIVVTIAVNGMVCHDTVFHVDAKPVAPIEVVRFGLRGSTYEEGCFGPCDCAVTSWTLLGRLGLLKLTETNEGIDYAVLDVDWQVRRSASATDETPVTGFGLYRVSKADGLQRMLLDLIENGAGPTHFDSGTVPGGGNRTRVDVDLAESAFACFDRVYSVHARRRPQSNTYVQGTSPEPVTMPVAPAP